MKKLVVLVFSILAIHIFSQSPSDTTSWFRYIDFAVFYRTGERIVRDKPIYKIDEDGHFRYKYSPQFAWLISPLTVLPQTTAAYIFLFLCGLALFLAFLKIDALLPSHSAWIYLILLIIFAKHLVKEFYLGQINTLILALWIGSVLLPRIKAAFCLSFSLFIKPVGLILIPWFMLKRKSYVLFDTLIWSVIWILTLGLIYLFGEPFYELHHGWMIELMDELKHKSNVLDLDNQSLNTFFSRVLHIHTTWSIILSLIIYGIIWIKLFAIKRYSGLLILSITPLVISTSNNFFIMAMPMFLIGYAYFKKMNIIAKIGVILASFLMAFNQYELFGRAGVDFIDYYCPYAISLLVMSITIVYSHIHLKLL